MSTTVTRPPKSKTTPQSSENPSSTTQSSNRAPTLPQSSSTSRPHTAASNSAAVAPRVTNTSNNSNKKSRSHSSSENSSNKKGSSDGRSSDTAKNVQSTPTSTTTRSSIFGGGNHHSNSSIPPREGSSAFSEADRVATKRGKMSIQALQAEGASSTHESPSRETSIPPTDDESAERQKLNTDRDIDDSTDHQEDSRAGDFESSYRGGSRAQFSDGIQRPRLPTIGSRISQEVENRVQTYHSELRRRYVMQMLREDDLLHYSQSFIVDQGIVVDAAANMIYHPRHPQVRQIIRPLEDAEIRQIRARFAAPFSMDDPTTSRRMITTNRRDPNERWPPYEPHREERERDIPPHMNRNSGGPPADEPPNGGDGSDDNSSRTDSDSVEAYDDRSDGNIDVAEAANTRNVPRPRLPSEDPDLGRKTKWTYDPRPRSEEEMLAATFLKFENLIKTQLHCPPLQGNNNIQKTLIQALPKPGHYYGDDDLTVWDDFLHDLVRWMNMAGLCGPEVRWSVSKKKYVLTSVDIQRINALAVHLKSGARQWFMDVIERANANPDTDDPLEGKWTFLQVIAAMYQRFIHEASLSKVSDQYNSVHYSRSRGVEELFSTLKRYALNLPTPPDAYTFRKRLVLLLPQRMTEDMARIHRVSAEKSTLHEIMVAAIAVEQSDKTCEYYNEARRKLDRTRRRRSRSRSRSKDKRRSDNPYRRRERSPSPRRLQKVEGRRYSVKPPSKEWDKHRQSRYSQRDQKFKQNNGSADRRELKPFVRPTFTKNNDSKNDSRPGQVFRMTDEDGNVRLCRIVEVEDSPKDESPAGGSSEDDDDDVFSNENGQGSENESEPDHSPGSLEGSQYSDDESSYERTGFMRAELLEDSEPSDYESYTIGNCPDRFGASWEVSESDTEYETCNSGRSEVGDEPVLTLDFPEYLRSMETKEDGSVMATLEPKLTKKSNVGTRPKRTNAEKRCLAGWITINNVKAFVLFDSGSTADAISPDFARNAKLRLYRLENPVTLQLGTKGSRSRITYGCTSQYTLETSKGPVKSKDYFDVANVDRYDAVVGTVFMRKHGITLDFKSDTVRTKDAVVPTLSEGEELAELVRRAAKRVSDNIQLQDGEEIEIRPRPRPSNKPNIPKSAIPKFDTAKASKLDTKNPKTMSGKEKDKAQKD
ncbi:hypothetical protein PQX77_011546 [Marasmius sp. AFHP31]|nr:hypothetical protein PQX77_011546 [Marasmius sp. AFHP31]